MWEPPRWLSIQRRRLVEIHLLGATKGFHAVSGVLNREKAGCDRTIGVSRGKSQRETPTLRRYQASMITLVLPNRPPTAGTVYIFIAKYSVQLAMTGGKIMDLEHCRHG
ncbi:hypothetical protein GCM10009838_54620 [Catenulispora subtropica]|uniref:Transposase n=1 Tax=Catenulispora subtropica TaxID=450798 RepID=A0ABN2SG03_9ACTN